MAELRIQKVLPDLEQRVIPCEGPREWLSRRPDLRSELSRYVPSLFVSHVHARSIESFQINSLRTAAALRESLQIGALSLEGLGFNFTSDFICFDYFVLFSVSFSRKSTIALLHSLIYLITRIMINNSFYIHV